jgi:hypothetical protein
MSSMHDNQYSIEDYEFLRKIALSLIETMMTSGLSADEVIDAIRRPEVPDKVYVDLREMMNEDIDEF